MRWLSSTTRLQKIGMNKEFIVITNHQRMSPLELWEFWRKKFHLTRWKKNAGTSNSQAGAQTIIKSIVHRLLESAICDIDDILYSPTPSTVFVDNTVETWKFGLNMKPMPRTLEWRAWYSEPRLFTFVFTVIWVMRTSSSMQTFFQYLGGA